MTRALTPGSGTISNIYSSTDDFLTIPQVESQKGSVAVTLICHYTRAIFTRKVNHRAAYRHQVVNLIVKARNPNRCIDEFLQVCATEGGPDGLDVAIDVLSQTGSLILTYAWAYLEWDIRNWGPSSGRAYQPNDDYWYALLRSVGRAQISDKERYRFIICCSIATSRGIREGVVESLRDLDTPAAKDRLRRFAHSDADPFIRQIAQEALDDLES